MKSCVLFAAALFCIFLCCCCHATGIYGVTAAEDTQSLKEGSITELTSQNFQQLLSKGPLFVKL